MDNNKMLKEVTKTDRTIYKIGWICLLVTSFCYGYTSEIFEKPKKK